MLRFVYIIGFVCCFFGLHAQTKKDSLAKSEFSIYKYKLKLLKLKQVNHLFMVQTIPVKLKKILSLFKNNLSKKSIDDTANRR